MPVSDPVEIAIAQRVIPVIRTQSLEAARTHCQVLAVAGYRQLEITLTTPGALKLIAELSEDPDLCVGAGSVLTQGDAVAATSAGAEFIVSPVTPEWIIPLGAELGVPVIPGAATPTEAYKAAVAGARLIKIFPIARLGGAAFIRDLLAPMPDLALMATGGVSGNDAKDLLDAGCKAVGVGSIMEDIQLGSNQEERARGLLQQVNAFGR